MGPTLVRKRGRLVEDECPNFEDDLGADYNKCDKLLTSLVEDSGRDDVDVPCLVSDVDPRSKLVLETLGSMCLDYDAHNDNVEKLRGDGNPRAIRSCLPRRIKRRRISAEDEGSQYKLFMEKLREDRLSYALEVVRENGVSELIRYHQDGRRITRRCVATEDVDPQYKLFLEALREDGKSYAFEVVQENGISELVRYHHDGLVKQIKRRCISIEDVDPQYKLFMGSLRVDANSYALEVVRESGILELIRYHQDKGSGKQLKSRSVCNEDLEKPKLVDSCEKSLSSVKHGSDENEHSGDDSDFRSVDDSCDEFPGDDSDIRSVDDNDDWNELSGDGNVHVKSLGDDVVDPKSMSNLDNVREDETIYAQEIVQGTGILEEMRHHQKNVLPEEPSLAATEPMKNSMVKDRTETESRCTLENLQDLKKRKSSVMQKNAEMTALGPASGMENGVSGKRTCLEVSNKSEELNSDTPEASESSQEPEIVLKLFEKLREERMVKKNAKLEILNPVSGRTRGHSNEGTRLKAHSTPEEGFISSAATTDLMKNSLVKERTKIENWCTKRKISVMQKNTEMAALNPASCMDNGVSNKRPCLEVSNNSEKLNSDTPEALESSQVKEKHKIEHRVPKVIEKLREERMVKKNAKLEILNPVSGRTRGHSNEGTHLKAHNTPEGFISSPLKEKKETKRSFRRMKKEKVKIHRPKKSAHLLKTKGPETLRNKRRKSLHDLQDRKSYRVERTVEEEAEAEYPCSNRMNDLPYKRSGCGFNDFAKCDHDVDDEIESNQTDESYQDFLSSLKINNDQNMIYAPQHGRPKIYDVDIKIENAESSSDSDEIVLERDPVHQTPILLNCCKQKEDSDNDLQSHTNFREGLMKDLKRPYDEEEYLNLLTGWSRRKPATGHAKNLRGGVIKTYALEGEYGKPFFYVYKDLDEMIKAMDCRGSLNLLRGFFYWLKNLAQEGSFKPWTDAECLNVVRQQ